METVKDICQEWTRALLASGTVTALQIDQLVMRAYDKRRTDSESDHPSARRVAEYFTAEMYAAWPLLTLFCDLTWPWPADDDGSWPDPLNPTPVEVARNAAMRRLLSADLRNPAGSELQAKPDASCTR